MLIIKKKKSKISNEFLTGAIIVLLSLIVIVQIAVLSGRWAVWACGEVKVQDYATKQAPAKCQKLWVEGRI